MACTTLQSPKYFCFMLVRFFFEWRFKIVSPTPTTMSAATCLSNKRGNDPTHGRWHGCLALDGRSAPLSTPLCQTQTGPLAVEVQIALVVCRALSGPDHIKNALPRIVPLCACVLFVLVGAAGLLQGCPLRPVTSYTFVLLLGLCRQAYQLQAGPLSGVKNTRAPS